MASVSSKKKVRSFTEIRRRIFYPDGSGKAPQIIPAKPNIDEMINAWAEKEQIHIVQVSPCQGPIARRILTDGGTEESFTIRYAVIYMAAQDFLDTELTLRKMVLLGEPLIETEVQRVPVTEKEERIQKADSDAGGSPIISAPTTADQEAFLG